MSILNELLMEADEINEKIKKGIFLEKKVSLLKIEIAGLIEEKEFVLGDCKLKINDESKKVISIQNKLDSLNNEEWQKRLHEESASNLKKKKELEQEIKKASLLTKDIEKINEDIRSENEILQEHVLRQNEEIDSLNKDIAGKCELLKSLNSTFDGDLTEKQKEIDCLTESKNELKENIAKAVMKVEKHYIGVIN